MSTLAIPLEVRLAAPVLAQRFHAIVTALITLVARAFLKNPRRVGIIVPLCAYLIRTARRFERLAGKIAAGRLPQRRARASRPGSRPIALPRQYAWLIIDLRHEAAAYRNYLESLLGEPALKEILAAVPHAGRLLRPLCRMLALPAVGSPKASAPPAAGTEPPQAEPEPAPQAPPPPPSPRAPEAPCPRSRWPRFHNPTAKPA
jgi:hypothetical protein